jgi:hypothetical protein
MYRVTRSLDELTAGPSTGWARCTAAGRPGPDGHRAQPGTDRTVRTGAGAARRRSSGPCDGQRLGWPEPGHWAAPGAAPSGWWGGVGEPALTWTRAPHDGQRLMASVDVDDTAVHLRN